MITMKEISVSIKGKVKPDEKYFRLLTAYILTKHDARIFYDTKKFCNFLFTIGEEDGSPIFKWILKRRLEFLEQNKEKLLLSLMKVD